MDINCGFIPNFFLIICPVAEVNALLNRYPGSGLLDIGANIGMYTLPIAKAGKKVWSFIFAEVLFQCSNQGQAEEIVVDNLLMHL